MKIGIIVLCRFSSSRLPGKILRPVLGKPVLTYILERLALVKNVTTVVATSVEESDQPIADFCQKENIPCYRDSLNNVARRFLQCAEHHRFDYAIRINGDNIFTDPSLISEMMNFANNDYDMISNVKGRTFPVGMSVEIVKTTFYKRMIRNFTEDQYTEHVTLYFYEFPESGRFRFYYNEKQPKAAGIKLALDDTNDLKRIENMIRIMDRPHIQYDMEELVELYEQVAP